MASTRDRIVETRIRSVLLGCLVWAGVACDSNGLPHSQGGTGGNGAGTGGATTATGGNGAGTGGATTATGGAGTGGAAGGNAANTGGAGAGGGASSVRACGTGDVRQPFSFRVEVPAGMPALAVGAFASVTKEINGSVSGVTRVQEPCCAGGSVPAVRIDVTESGVRWAVVVKPGSAIDSFEAAAGTLANTQVKLMIRLRQGFQPLPSQAFTVRATNGDLLMAVETGPFVRTLDAVDLGPLTITNGADVCQEATCFAALWIYTQLQFAFSGGPSAVVGLGATVDLTFAQRRYSARNDGGGYYDPNTIRNCSDPEKAPTWAIWSAAAGP